MKSNSSIVLRAGKRAALMRVAAVTVAAVGFGFQERGGELLVAPLLGASAIGELGQRAGRGRRLEDAE